MASAAVQHSLGSEHFGSAEHYNQHATAVTSTQKTNAYEPRDIIGVFNYFKDSEDGSPPLPSYVGKPETYFRETVALNHTVHDIRGSEDKYKLDTTGFQVVKQESVEKDFLDDEQIKNVYYPEVEEILKKATGGNRVLIFDHTIRRQPQQVTSAEAKFNLRGPVQRVHIDQSYAAAPNRVTHHLPAEATELLKHRYQIINLWRPIKTIRKDPLAVAAANSVPDTDLVPIKLIYPDREGETYSVRPNEGHRWFYLNEHGTDEALLIKCFDSEEDGRARRVPHSAFIDEERVGEASRESIEVRALVFFAE